MNRDPEQRLGEASDALADEKPVDWEALRAESPELGDTIEGLRILESVAAAHREARGAIDGGPATGHETRRAVPLFQWGTLEVLEKLGEGSFAEVFRAFDPQLAREVALKLRRESTSQTEASQRRWLEEARRLARVRHPNVMVIHGVGVHGGRAGISTELLRGSTLEEWLLAHGPMSAREAALIGIELCSALAAVHAAGLVHGDVKASNVLREGPAASDATERVSGMRPGDSAGPGAGRIVLLDFGAALERSDGGTEGPVFATPIVTAPEVLLGEEPSQASDIYSLGMLLYRLVTGRYPVEADTVEELRSRLLRGERMPLREARPDLPAAYVQAVERAIALEPEQRPASVSGLERALSEVLGSAPATRRTWLRRRIVPAMAAAALAAAMGLFLLPRALQRTLSTPAAPSGSSVDGPSARLVNPASMAIDATLFRGAGADREPLESGSRVVPGDHLSLEVEGRDDLHLYVLNEDRQGVLAVLFPVPGVDLKNPLPGGKRHRLPGNRGGHPLDWQVTSAGGRETFLIVASRTRLEDIESQVANLPRASEGQPVSFAEMPSAKLHRLRGVMGLTEAPEAAGAGGWLEDLARSLASHPRPDLWTRLLQVESSPP